MSQDDINQVKAEKENSLELRQKAILNSLPNNNIMSIPQKPITEQQTIDMVVDHVIYLSYCFIILKQAERVGYSINDINRNITPIANDGRGA